LPGFVKNALLMAVSLFVALLMVEAALRYLEQRKWEPQETGFNYVNSPLYASLGKSNSTGLHETLEFTVTLSANADGFRMDSEDQDARIAFIGDSYTWGTGVEREERFSNLLAQSLGQPVSNWGLATSGTINELAVYQDFVKAARPEIVVLMFYPNDVQNNSWWSGYFGGRAFDQPNLQEVMNEVRELESRPAGGVRPDPFSTYLRIQGLISQVWERIFSVETEQTVSFSVSNGSIYEIGRQHVEATSNWSAALETYSVPIENGWALTELALEQLADQVKGVNAKLLVGYIPYQEAVYPEDWPQRKTTFRLEIPDELLLWDKPREVLEQLAGKVGAEFVDLTPALIANRGQRLYYLFDGHLTAHGHVVVAETLQPVISAALAGP